MKEWKEMLEWCIDERGRLLALSWSREASRALEQVDELERQIYETLAPEAAK